MASEFCCYIERFAVNSDFEKSNSSLDFSCEIPAYVNYWVLGMSVPANPSNG